MTRPPGSAHGTREWNNLRGHKVGRYVTPHIPTVDPSYPKGYSPTAKMNLARRRQLAAIDQENKQLLWRMQTLRPSYSLSAIEADYERRNQLLESRKRGQGLRLCDHYAAQAALPVDAGLRRPLPASRSMPELPAAWSPLPPSNPKPYTEP